MIMQQPSLLFTLNALDAGLTILWTQLGLAEEGNRLMGYLLQFGPGPFLLFKIAIGLFAAWCFYRWAHLPAARIGLRLALGVYGVILLIHLGVAAMACGIGPWLGM
jgi:hypothetical protein